MAEPSQSDFDEIVQRRLTKPLTAAVRDCLDEQARKEWNEDEYAGSVSQILQSGDFRLVIVVDSVNEELRRTIEYLAQGPSHLGINALEVGYFTDGQGEILVPHLHGVKPSTTTEGTMGRWTEVRFFADVEKLKSRLNLERRRTPSSGSSRLVSEDLPRFLWQDNIQRRNNETPGAFARRSIRPH